ncbi:MAG: xanthine dehydrogenase [Gammaproteobacteria bacterium]|nr:xanthine dehydrogenase [Gammaproteobacteria bacterium]
MQLETLQALNKACRELRPVALVTDLNDGAQVLYYADSDVSSAPLSNEDKLLAQQVLILNSSKRFQLDERDLFIQAFNTPLRMIVIGAVHIAQDLISIANQCEFRVTLVDPRPVFASETRFPNTNVVDDWPDKALQALNIDGRTAVITLSHDPKLDDPALEIALNSNAFYIGSLGSRRTHTARLERLEAKGFSAEKQALIRGPIGLDIGAKSTTEIAISIMAEVIQKYRQSSE